MPAIEHETTTQTPGQWAVRWFAVVAASLLCASVPLHHFVWHGLLGHDEAQVRLRSQKPAPAVTFEGLTSGEWAEQQARALQEDSPVAWWLRGNWNELRFRAGVITSDRVHFGEDGWLFLGDTVRPRAAAFAGLAEPRRALLTEVRDRLRAAGVELVVSVVPSKARIYPDKAFADGVLPAGVEGDYRAVLDELAELGIPAVDLATPLRAAAQAVTGQDDEQQVYFRRDTHWRPGGALVAGQVVAAQVEARFGRLLAKRSEMALNGPSSRRAVSDLTDLLGLLSCIRVADDGDQRPIALSLLTDELAEERQYYGVDVVTPGGKVPMFGTDDAAEVFHVGTSFAKASGMQALAFALGRPTRAFVERGASGVSPMKKALAAVENGLRPKVVVWEIVERGTVAKIWAEPLGPR